MSTLWQQVRTATRTRLVTQLPTILTGSGAAVPTVYTNEPRNNAALPFVVVERVADVRNQVFDDDKRVTVLDFQVRIVSIGRVANASNTQGMYENAVMRALERHKLTGLTGWTVDKINYVQSLTVQETDDAIVSIVEFTLLGQATA